jgi:DNA polymerase (family 10)
VAVEGLSDDELRQRLRAQTLTEVPGIGGALAAVITELAVTGQSTTLEGLRAAAPAALLELSQLPGVSRERARMLHEALGVNDLDELAAAARDQRVRTVKGFGPKTEAAILTAIDAHRRRPQAIRLIDARAAATALAEFIAARPGVLGTEVAGGVRLWDEVVDELSVVATVEEAMPAAELLAAYPPLARIEKEPEPAAPDRAVGRLADGVRVRLRVARPSERGLALLEETGPASHLASLKARATATGSDWHTLTMPDEAALYARLDLPFLPPETRTWSALPSTTELNELVKADDVRGLIHCHTTYSDGRHSVTEMAEAAEARGADYMTITDHSPAAAYAGGVEIDRLREQWAEIARVQQTVGVHLLRGTESDILEDGALDYPDAVLGDLDVIIASIHQRHRLDATAMTARLVRAMKLPVFKIWGHPLGRLILRREPIACEVEVVLDAAASSRVAIEISGDPYRLDLPPVWIPAARQRGIPFVISTDAHAIADLENLEYGVAMARRAGVRRGEVLNALPFAAFRDAVRP